MCRRRRRRRRRHRRRRCCRRRRRRCRRRFVVVLVSVVVVVDGTTHQLRCLSFLSCFRVLFGAYHQLIFCSLELTRLRPY